MKRVTVLTDYKSGTYQSVEQRLQLGGYYLAPELYDKGTGQWGVKPPVDYGMILHTGPTAVKPLLILTQAELMEAASLFQEALRLYRYLAKYDPHIAPPSRYPIEGVEYVSVTEVLKYVVAKPGLLGWYAKMAKEGKDPNAVRDARAAEGSTIHKNLLFFMRGDAVTLPDSPHFLTDTVVRFERWSREWKAEVLRAPHPLLEQTLVHRELGYAGSNDSVLTVEEGKLMAWLRAKQEAQGHE